MRATKHKTRWSKRFGCDIDVLVFPAVEAMNDLLGVETLSSCQGDPGIIGEGGAYGYIAFCVKGGWRELCEFCFVTLGAMFREYLDDEIRVNIFAKVEPYAWLNFRHETLALVTGRLRGIGVERLTAERTEEQKT